VTAGHFMEKEMWRHIEGVASSLKASANTASWGDTMVAQIRKLFKRLERFWGRGF
jgi:hypothetical protein